MNKCPIGRKGEDHVNAKISEKTVKDILKLSKIFKPKEIAKMFTLSSAHVSAIIRRKTWKHLDHE